MIGASKILTVSYGTFSCTLEGFDDPFNTMRAIAEYFRDLAAEDRYFGAEPPTPDAAMLLKIAEREVQRRVEAKIQDNGVVLRTGSAVDTAAFVSAPMAPLAASPAPSRAPVTPDAAFSPMPDGVAAKLLRIRAAVANAELVVAADDPAPEFSPAKPILADYSEDQHADVFGGDTALAATFADDGLDAATIADTAYPLTEVATDAGPEAAVADAEVPAMTDAAFDRAGWHDDADQAEAEPETPTADAATEDLPAPADPVTDAGPVAEDTLFADAGIDFALPDTDAVDAPTFAEDAEISAQDIADLQALDAAAAAFPEVADADEDRRSDTGLAFGGVYDDEDMPPALDAPLEAALAKPAQPDETTAYDYPEVAETDPAFPETDPALAQTDPAFPETDPVLEQTDPAFPETDPVLEKTDPAFTETDAALAPTDPVFAAIDPVLEEIDNAYAPVDTADRLPSDKVLRARARLIKVRRDGSVADNGPGRPAARPPLADTIPAEASAEVAAMLADRADDALRRDLRALQIDTDTPNPNDVADETGPEDDGRKRLDTAGEEAVSRLIEQTNEAMAVPENRRRLSAIAHLKAAVAATVADRFSKGRSAPQDQEAIRLDPYREDLARVVRPQHPNGTDDAHAVTRPAPLVLVSAQRIDRPRTQPSDSTTPLTAVPNTPVRPRRVTSAQLAADPSSETDDEDEGSEAANIFSDARGFAEFSERLGANSLAEILEAAAAYSVCIEGRPYFSRPQLMGQIGALSADSEYTREDGLRTFGMLLRDGRIQKIKRGQFVLTESSRYLTEARRLAR